MKPTDRFSGLHRTLSMLIALAAAGTALPGCVYRPTIQQGNLLLQSDIDQVKPGMTRSQVRYILGTPMVTDPFEPNRWDYIYTLRQGRSTHVDRSHFVVHFEGDKVSRVESRDMIEETETQKIIRRQRESAAAAAATVRTPPASAPAEAPAPSSAPATQPPPPATEKPPGGG
ncbi:MAG: outer membrane protein assembly factor BamE [Gammaproteobacteria bacterium]|nr:outer membrane protein assembly factor BamE [Gammaproteobacteria bacterium]